MNDKNTSPTPFMDLSEIDEFLDSLPTYQGYIPRYGYTVDADDAPAGAAIAYAKGEADTNKIIEEFVLNQIITDCYKDNATSQQKGYVRTKLESQGYIIKPGFIRRDSPMDDLKAMAEFVNLVQERIQDDIAQFVKERGLSPNQATSVRWFLEGCISLYSPASAIQKFGKLEQIANKLDSISKQ